MTNTISPVTDNIYHFPGGYEPQAPADAELPTSGAPIREGSLVAPEQTDADREIAQALYADALTAATADSGDVAGMRAEVNSAYATETIPQVVPSAAEREHAAEALLRARAFTDGIVNIREHAVGLEESRTREDYRLAA